jgi:hypothetical protein
MPIRAAGQAQVNPMSSSAKPTLMPFKVNNYHFVATIAQYFKNIGASRGV